MRILLLNTQMEAAGAQKAMLTLARGLQMRGHSVTVATMYDKGEYVPLFQCKYGVTITNLNMRPIRHASCLKKAACALTGLVRLWQLMRREKFDVVQTFTHYSNIIGPVVAWFTGVKCRVSSQRNALVGHPRWLLWIDRMVANSSLVHKMVAVSEDTREFSMRRQGISASKLITIYNSVSSDYFRPFNLSDETRSSLRFALCEQQTMHIVLTVAKLHPQKGHTYLLQAIPAILKEFPHTHFLFAGEGEILARLQRLVQQLAITTKVTFMGVRHDIPELMSLSDVVILPSLWEGMPNVVLEAMAVGVPVIATSVGGCPEMISSGESGILVPPADSDALAKALCQLLDNPDLRESLAKTARRWAVEHVTEEKFVSSFEHLYNRLLMVQPKEGIRNSYHEI